MVKEDGSLEDGAPAVQDSWYTLEGGQETQACLCSVVLKSRRLTPMQHALTAGGCTVT